MVRQYVNEDRTILISFWKDGSVTVATREHPGDIWGPPIMMTEEHEAYAR